MAAKKQKTESKEVSRKKGGRPTGENWASEKTHFDYEAGGLDFRLRTQLNFWDPGRWSLIACLEGLFEVAEDSKDNNIRRIFLTKELHTRVTQVFHSRTVFDPEIEIGELLYRALIDLGAFACKALPLADDEMKSIDPSSVRLVAETLLLERKEIKTQARALMEPLFSYSKLIAHGSPSEITAASKSVEKIFSHAGKRWAGKRIPEVPKRGGMTCNYRSKQDAPIHPIAIEFAAIEGAYLLTEQYMKNGELRLPTKSQLWHWMYKHVLKEVPLMPDRESDILKRAGLSALPMKQRLSRK